MKNAVLLAGIWVGIILVAYAIAYVNDGGPAVAVLRGDLEYTENAGRFVVPVPVGWATIETQYGLQLAPPIRGLDVWAVGVAAETVEEALAAALEKVDPCPSCQRGEPTSVLTSQGVEGATRGEISFDPDSEGRRVSATVLIAQGQQAAVLIVQSTGEPIPSRVSADLARIQTGFAVPPIDGTMDLDPVMEPAT